MLSEVLKLQAFWSVSSIRWVGVQAGQAAAEADERLAQVKAELSEKEAELQRLGREAAAEREAMRREVQSIKDALQACPRIPIYFLNLSNLPRKCSLTLSYLILCTQQATPGLLSVAA